MSSSFPTQSECTRYEIFEYAHEPNRTSNQSDLDKIILLIFLYFLQGIPLGMTAAIPLILQAQANHPPDLPKRLAIFSMAMWPFALKFVFAPIIDSLKLPYLGLRKSWLFISQTGIAIALLVASASVRNAVLIFDIHTLLGLFLPLCLCAAIQDVAVDGWALALLSMPSWASTCNCVGQSAGFIFGTAAVTLIDWKYANNLFWWLGIAFICSTLILIIFKKEKTTACMNNITPVVA
ncbi:hypothetical protein ACOME3_009596 [Neoechinorhynchus agilis]